MPHINHRARRGGNKLFISHQVMFYGSENATFRFISGLVS
jgi:hypothetical protein